jgi:hypothetical protein
MKRGGVRFDAATPCCPRSDGGGARAGSVTGVGKSALAIQLVQNLFVTEYVRGGGRRALLRGVSLLFLLRAVLCRRTAGRAAAGADAGAARWLGNCLASCGL